MRRTLFFTALLFGLLIAVIPVGPAAASGDPCDKDFPARLDCWTAELGDGSVTVTLNKSLAYDGSEARRRAAVDGVPDFSNLQVRVPAGVSTGQGGTALLVLAGDRLVDPDARIDRLDNQTLKDLTDLHACNEVCQALAPAKKGQSSSLAGSELIKQPGVADLGTHTFTVGERESTDYLHPLLIALTAVLLLLLLGLLLAVRRSRAPAEAVASVGVRAEETTTRLRPVSPAPAPAPSPGRRVGPRTGPSRTGIVRTALHPQGYVELDHVLYRAVWAEPERTPPVPGAYVEVTDAHEPDSDVLYAFPPAARHHARGS
ncbi:hypothetical protein AB0I69_37290 [Streptomyces sp. NPDC050508]|uniref:hypothetical protein n=1 Tax=Streptomyces sp. NPDC050508 TaxID=3155405 RepID=UPI00344921D8